MPNILLCLAYDGTDFCGYQIQERNRTVQGELELALYKCLSEKITVYASGRTDSGVHAEKQFVNFNITDIHIPPERVCYALNTLLPADIRVFWSKEVDKDFHARFSAISRSYYYQLFIGEVLSPIHRHFGLQIKQDLDWALIYADLQQLVGTYDFTSFSSENKDITNHIRTIHKIEIVEPYKNCMRIYITANGFLWKMVRTIVGTVLERAIKRTQSKELEGMLHMKEILEKKDRSIAGSSAPPHGLFLYNVEYNNKYEL